MAAMPMPQSLRRDRKFLGVIVLLDGDVVFMVFVSMGFFSWGWSK